ncbi:hypothetical protein ACLK2H_12550 [Escherichia coli]
MPNTAGQRHFVVFMHSPGYMDGVLAARMPAVLNQRQRTGLSAGVILLDGFTSPIYRQALLSDFWIAAKQVHIIYMPLPASG